MILGLLNLLMFVLLPRIWFILDVPYVWNIFSADTGWRILSMSIRYSRLIFSFSSSIFLLIFWIMVLLMTKWGTLTSPTVNGDLSSFSFEFYQFSLCVFWSFVIYCIYIWDYYVFFISWSLYQYIMSLFIPGNAFKSVLSDINYSHTAWFWLFTLCIFFF